MGGAHLEPYKQHQYMWISSGDVTLHVTMRRTRTADTRLKYKIAHICVQRLSLSRSLCLVSFDRLLQTSLCERTKKTNSKSRLVDIMATINDPSSMPVDGAAATPEEPPVSPLVLGASVRSNYPDQRKL